MIPITETAMHEHEAIGITVEEVTARGHQRISTERSQSPEWHRTKMRRTKPIAKMAPDENAPNEANRQNGMWRECAERSQFAEGSRQYSVTRRKYSDDEAACLRRFSRNEANPKPMRLQTQTADRLMSYSSDRSRRGNHHLGVRRPEFRPADTGSDVQRAERSQLPKWHLTRMRRTKPIRSRQYAVGSR
jgi:hypothetical protein